MEFFFHIGYTMFNYKLKKIVFSYFHNFYFYIFYIFSKLEIYKIILFYF